jgi:cold-inducible RNA-binding protein
MTKKLYVGNLPYATTEDVLKSTFAQYGTLETAVIIKDRQTGQSKGFGFVEYSTRQEAVDAISKLNGSLLEGKVLKVSEAKPQEPRPSFSR